MPKKPLQQNGISPPSYRLASRAICSEYGNFPCILAGIRLSLGPADASPGPKKRFGQMVQIRYQQLFLHFPSSDPWLAPKKPGIAGTLPEFLVSELSRYLQRKYPASSPGLRSSAPDSLRPPARSPNRKHATSG